MLATTPWVYHPGGVMGMGGNFYPEQGVQIWVGVVSVFSWSWWEERWIPMERRHDDTEMSSFLSLAHNSLFFLTYSWQFLEILWLLLAAKVVLAQVSSIQVLVRACQTASQAIPAHALGNTGVRDYSSHPSHKPVALPCFLHPVPPFTVGMFFNWHCRQVTLKTSSQNIYWGKRMVENLFIFLFYNISSQQGEQKQTRERDGDSLAWYCFQHPHIGKQGNRGHLIVLFTLWNLPDPTEGSMAALFPGIFLPQDRKPGLAAWTGHQTPGQAEVPESPGALIVPEQFSCNVSDFAVSSITGDNITSLLLN